MTRNGFTLSELLIALLILGVVATFAIPKILEAQTNQQNKAVLKETIAALSEIVYQGYVDKSLPPGSVGNHLKIFNRLNALKICPSDSVAEGCFTQPAPSVSGERNQGGAILPSGATIAGLYDSGWEPVPNEWEDMFLVDANGSKGPNVEGTDQIILMVCYGPNEWCSNSWSRRGTIRAPSSWTSEAYYEELFKR